MSRRKWILAGILSVVLFFLIRDGFLAACTLDIVGNAKANFFLGCTVVGFVVVGLIVTEKYKGWVSSIPAICLATLIAIGFSAWHTSCTENKEKKGKDNMLTFREEVEKEKQRIMANIITEQATQELGLSQKKSSSGKQKTEKPGNKVKILDKKPLKRNWGKDSATQELDWNHWDQRKK